MKTFEITFSITPILCPMITFFDASHQDSIATASQGAIVATHVGIISIPIVTCLQGRLNESIPASAWDTGIKASVIIVCITVVTEFDPGVYKPIPAPSHHAVVQAAVGLIAIPIVARLGGIEDTVSTPMDDARSDLARLGTDGAGLEAIGAVLRPGVSIITRLRSDMNNPVPTPG